MGDDQAVDRVLLNAVTSGSATYSPRAGARPQRGFHHHVEWAEGTVAGAVAVETADSETYAGTWALIDTVTFSGSPSNEGYLYTPGQPKALRHRLSTVVPATYADVIVNDAPTAYWKMGDAVPGSPPPYISFADTIGTRHATNNVTAAGVVNQVVGALSDGTKGAKFTGTQRPDTFTSYDLVALARWSIEFWIRPQIPTDGFGTIVASSPATGTPGGIWTYDNSGAIMLDYEDGVISAQYNTTPLVAGALYHVVLAARNSSSATWYINGVADGTIVSPTGFTASTLVADDVGSDRLIADLLDEVAIYPSTLTAAQAANHYAVGFGTFVPSCTTRLVGGPA